jgi:hypothetical protein
MGLFSNSERQVHDAQGFVLTSNSRDMTLVHEGRVCHSAYTADTVLRQLLADDTTAPASIQHGQDCGIFCET